MNAFSDWLLHSFAVGALAAAAVWFCPQGWRSRVRQAVPVVAFVALLLLAIGLVRPLPRVEVQAPAALAKWGEETPGMAWLTWLWLAGCAVCGLRLAAESLAVHRLLKNTQPVIGRAWQQLLAECQQTLGMRGRVRLRLAGPGFVPSAAGLLRRTVLLPDESRSWTHEQRRLVLLHELGHFRRGDLWAHTLGRLACAVHWFNPFAWLLQRQLPVEREFACDALVIERGAAPDDYATLLFEMATASRHRLPVAAAFLTMASPRTGKLEARVRRILTPTRRIGKFARLFDTTACAAAALVLLVCAACKPVARLLPQTGSWSAIELQQRLAADPFPGER